MTDKDRLMLAFAWLGLVVMVGGVFFSVATMLSEIRNDIKDAAQVHAGKASYLPGGACVIAATEDQSAADIVNYARACAKEHEMWLKASE